jgi:hypothetical protein
MSAISGIRRAANRDASSKEERGLDRSCYNWIFEYSESARSPVMFGSSSNQLRDLLVCRRRTPWVRPQDPTFMMFPLWGGHNIYAHHQQPAYKYHVSRWPMPFLACTPSEALAWNPQNAEHRAQDLVGNENCICNNYQVGRINR